MPPQISVTTSRTDQSKAARALSDALNSLGCPHAYIGGFAWALLGSTRPTQDIDVLIEISILEMEKIHTKLSEISRKFAESNAIKLFYVQDLKDDLTGIELIQANKNNVLIETLRAGSLGLPSVAGPTYPIQNEDTGVVVQILHPGILFLTKVKRWYFNRESDYPKTVLKTASDRRDLEYLLEWLVENEMTIEFEQYQGKSKKDLLVFVKGFKDMSEEDEELMITLQRAMKATDWEAMSAPTEV
ncbi:hypothetical protein CPB83DRAFT_810353 [Crepidotus variabilis]|uniref:Uncharacterized protein n=1 Tax=Crepidotus variabilis TaxID=179855 RepID=A0A9P6EKK9_9AGAR|nr:hypothetical protein CPB83DRAFT_810353 [Crepidotus variabilis]